MKWSVTLCCSLLLLGLLVSCDQREEVVKTNRLSQYTEQDILNELDNSVKNNVYFWFPDFNHGYYYPASSRIHLYRSETKWAIVFETVQYSISGLDYIVSLDYFGSHLVNLPDHYNDRSKLSNSNLVSLTNNERLGDYIDDLETVEDLEGKSFLLREKVEIPFPEAIDFKNYQVTSDHYVHPLASSLRVLVLQYPDVFKATDSELQSYITDDLQEIMTIHSWHHKPYHAFGGGASNAKPSSYETFPLIAKVLVTGDTTLYKPTLPANNHWSNWPNAGSL